MEANLVGEFYEPVILQLMKPRLVDISVNDYIAGTVSIKPGESEKQKPFIVAHNEPVTLKVETWLGEVITWKFTAGPYPMLLKRIIKDAANKVTDTGVALTTVQISY